MRTHALSSHFILLAVILIVSGCCHTHVPKLSNMLQIVDTRQATTYTCGVASVQAILNYYGIDKREDQLTEQFGATEAAGTSTSRIIAGLVSYGLVATRKEHTTLDDLRANVQNKIPTIVAIQAWLDEYPPHQDWSEIWEEGHWAIVIGLDDKNVYFEDPSLLGTCGRLTHAEFLARWHDYDGDAPCCDANDKKLIHLSISVKGTSVKWNKYTHID